MKARPGAWLPLAFIASSLGACQQPTQVELWLSTDLECERVRDIVGVTVGPRGQLEDREFTTTPPIACRPAADGSKRNELGMLVVLPSGSESQELGVKIVVPVTAGTYEQCRPNATDPSVSYKGCIVARRTLRFAPNLSLRVPVPLLSQCEDVACDADSTCYQAGLCVLASVACDGSSCASEGDPETKKDDPFLRCPPGATREPVAGEPAGTTVCVLREPSAGSGGMAGSGGVAGQGGAGAGGAGQGGAGEGGAGQGGAGEGGAGEGGAGQGGAGEGGAGEGGAGQGGAGAGGAGAGGAGAGGAGEAGAGASGAGAAGEAGAGAAGGAGAGAAGEAGGGAGGGAGAGGAGEAGAGAAGAGAAGEAGGAGTGGVGGGGAGGASGAGGQAGAPSSALAVAAGDTHACAIVDQGQVYCWGGNSNGQLGDGSITPKANPVLVTRPGGVPLTKASALALGGSHSCAIVGLASEVFCWGFNGSGQLGDGTVLDHRQPEPVKLSGAINLAGVLALDLGANHSCAIDGTNRVLCWGDDLVGQLGDNKPETEQRNPVTVQQQIGGDLTGVQALALGVNHGCALVAGGQLRCWGTNGFGQIGDGTLLERPSAVPVLLPAGGNLLNASLPSLGENHSCAVVGAAKEAQCWGRNNAGQLGDDSTTTHRRPEPVKFGAATLTDVRELALGDAHSCSRTAAGTVLCWGDDVEGQLGDGAALSQQLKPVPVVFAGGLPLTGVDSLSLGGSFSCARGGSKVHCWGRNAEGQLGDGSTTPKPNPVLVNLP